VLLHVAYAYIQIKFDMQMHCCKLCLWDKKNKNKNNNNNNNNVNKPNTGALDCSV